MVQVPNIKLNSGFDMPQVGFGLWKVDNAIAADTVYEAIKLGYRLFDGACGESLLVSAPPPYIEHRLSGKDQSGEEIGKTADEEGKRG